MIARLATRCPWFLSVGSRGSSLLMHQVACGLLGCFFFPHKVQECESLCNITLKCCIRSGSWNPACACMRARGGTNFQLDDFQNVCQLIGVWLGSKYQESEMR